MMYCNTLFVPAKEIRHCLFEWFTENNTSTVFSVHIVNVPNVQATKKKKCSILFILRRSVACGTAYMRGGSGQLT